MSNKLRAVFEGEGVDALRHLKRIARLKNEWPELFDAVEEVAYTNSGPVDIRAIADEVLKRAEQLNNPLTEVEREPSAINFTPTGGVEFRYNTSVASIDAKIIEQFIDNAIIAWRRIASDADHKHFDIAPYYVDAYQSVRESLLGETLPYEAVEIEEGHVRWK